MPEKPLDMHGDQPGSDASPSTNRPPFHQCSREGEDDPPARSGRPVSGLPRSRPITASQETCHACRARSPHLGKMPAASTEVVLAERLNSARPGAARAGDTSLSSLIPVLVTGIQCAFRCCTSLAHRAFAASPLTPSSACRHLLPAGEKRYAAASWSFSFRRGQRDGVRPRLAPSSPQRGSEGRVETCGSTPVGGPKGRMRGAARHDVGNWAEGTDERKRYALSGQRTASA